MANITSAAYSGFFIGIAMSLGGGHFSCYGQVEANRVISDQAINVGPGRTSPIITKPATPNQRVQREKLAPTVMTPQPKVDQKIDQQALEVAVFSESVKRLRNIEAKDPARALSEYRRFVVGRNPAPAVGVQAGIKVSKMRQRMGDFEGALMTCEVMAKRYAAEPSSVLLSLQKADVLMSQKQLKEASECVEEALPRMLALGPKHYEVVSAFLLKLAQANLDSKTAGGEERAHALYVGVEETYLRWLKSGTIPHTWQLFEGLQAKYQQMCDEQRAEELLPKAIDALLQMAPTPQNPEGADVSLMAARWLANRGRSADAMKLYAKVSGYGNAFVTEVGLLDQVKQLSNQGQVDEALQIARPVMGQAKNPDRIRVLSSLAYGYYVVGNFERAAEVSTQALQGAQSHPISEMEVSQGLAQATREWAQQWSTKPLLSQPTQLIVTTKEIAARDTIIKRLLIFSHQAVPLEASCNKPEVRVSIGDSGGTNQYTTAQQIAILIDPQNLPEGEVVVTVRSSKFPNFSLKIPLTMESVG